MLKYRTAQTVFLCLIAFLWLGLPQQGVAMDTSVSTAINLTASSVFAIEFYVDQNVIYSTTVPFSNVDPTQSLVYPNGRREDDGKSDTGVVCTSNTGAPWFLKIQGVYSAGLPDTSLKFYYSQPWNRNTGSQTSGGLTYNAQWLALPQEPSTIYTSGNEDTVNTPFGTLSTFSFAVDPRGLSADQAYTVAVTYTMTTAP